MKNKMIFKRIGALMCAVMVLICTLVGSTPYFADDYVLPGLEEGMFDASLSYDSFVFDVSLFPAEFDGKPWVIYRNSSGSNVFLVAFEDASWNVLYSSRTGGNDGYKYDFGISTVEDTNNSIIYVLSGSVTSPTWVEYTSSGANWFSCVVRDNGSFYWNKPSGKFLASNANFSVNGVVVVPASDNHNGTIYEEEDDDIPSDAEDIGYLREFSHLISYKRGTYYNYNEESRTDRWTFDLITTSGLDLSSGNYSVKHYVRPVLVTGYDDEDIVEKYDKFYDNSYDAINGYVQYLDKDLDGRLSGQGYDGPSWFDLYILGRFVLRWHYFQVVNDDTDEVGGLVRVRPKDVDDVNGGTEYIVEAVDENDNVLDDYDGSIAYRGEGSYVESEDETIEDAFDDAEDDATEQEEHTSIANLDGLEIFSSVMESFANSTADFSAVILNFFNCLPAWVLTVFGLSVALTFLMFIIKNLR